MRRKLLLLLFVLSALVVAGAWTGVGAAHTANGHHAASWLLSAVDFTSQVTEEAWFLMLGLCFVAVAVALHRRTEKPRG